MGRLVLASASPRRRQLLKEAGLEFEVQVSGVDESHDPDESPEVIAESLARRKATAVAEDSDEDDALYLGADTVVALEGEERWTFLAKPADADEACEMLKRLSGTRHAEQLAAVARLDHRWCKGASFDRRNGKQRFQITR